MSAWMPTTWERKNVPGYTADVRKLFEHLSLFSWWVHRLDACGRSACIVAFGDEPTLEEAQAKCDATIDAVAFTSLAQREQQILEESPSPSVLQ